MPLVAKDYWCVFLGSEPSVSHVADRFRLSLLFGNTLFLLAFGYFVVISFLGYHGKL